MMRQLIATVMAVGLFGATSGFAEDLRGWSSDAYRVDYADLDLTREADRLELELRVDRASRWICRDQIVRVSRIRCVQEAREGALAKLNANTEVGLEPAKLMRSK